MVDWCHGPMSYVVGPKPGYLSTNGHEERRDSWVDVGSARYVTSCGRETAAQVRNPYEAHLIAQDPIIWEDGFNHAQTWINIHGSEYAVFVYQAIAQSTNQPWPDTAATIGFQPDAHDEGLALGIYGIQALERGA